MSRFTLRRTVVEDSVALNGLYRSITGIARTHDEFLWEWFRGPEGPAPSWVIVDNDCDKVVAHHGVVRCPLWLGGHVQRAARTENSMVDANYRSIVPYVSYEAMLLKQLLIEFDIIFTTTGKGTPGAIRRRLGYQSVGYWRSFVISEPPGYLASRVGGQLVGKIVAAMSPNVGKRSNNLRPWVTQDCERIETLWGACRGDYSFSPARSASYLKWRLLDNPFTRSELVILTRDDKDFGFFSWSKSSSGRSGAEIHITDIFCRNNDQASYTEMLTVICEVFRADPVRVVLRTVASNAALCVAAAALVPRRLNSRFSDHGAELLVRTKHSIDLPASEMTMVITEGIL